MNGEQTMEDKIEYKSKTGHFWIGLRNGSDFPLNRNVYAMARSQEYRPGLRNGSIFTEFFVAKNPEIVRCSCHSMESVVKKLHFPDGTTPGLGKSTVWSSHTERVAIRPDSRSAHGQSNR